MICPDCGEIVTEEQAIEGGWCPICGEALQPEAAPTDAESVRCSAWLEALAKRWERRIKCHKNSARAGAVEVNRAIIGTLRLCVKELRTEGRNASNKQISDSEQMHDERK